MERLFKLGTVNFVGKVNVKFINGENALVTPLSVDVAQKLTNKKFPKQQETGCYVVPLKQVKVAA